MVCLDILIKRTAVIDFNILCILNGTILGRTQNWYFWILLMVRTPWGAYSPKIIFWPWVRLLRRYRLPKWAKMSVRAISTSRPGQCTFYLQYNSIALRNNYPKNAHWCMNGIQSTSEHIWKRSPSHSSISLRLHVFIKIA